MSNDVAPVALSIGHRWTRAEVKAIWARRGGLARARHYPGLLSAWGHNAATARWNPHRIARGLAPLPLIDIPKVRTPDADGMRERRDLARRRAKYEGVKYDDRMASDPALRGRRSRRGSR